MSTPLLVTKLFIPTTRPELVLRSRLSVRLDESLNQKLTLISAPAGFGKTTLVAEWVNSFRKEKINESQEDLRIAWLSLDKRDNDLTRFLTYFITALNQTNGRETTLGNGALNMLQSPQPPPTEATLTSLINEIATVPDRIFFILDDYHLIDSQAIHEALTFLLENLPPTMHLIIVTREDPLLQLSRLRARGQLVEVRATDLRFTPAEAAEFLNQAMGLALSEKDIAALETRTEGWIVGLQLAAISMQGHADVSTFVKSFTGSHRLVLDYLIEEVLGQQPENIQNFLLQTSILDRFTGSLCDALTGGDNGQQVLETLERANLFIIPLDEERRWYRYHHLFVDLLRQRLGASQPDLIHELHARAVEWYEAQDYLPEAIQHAFEGDDIPMAGRLIEKGALAALQKSDLKFILNWVARLPENALKNHPWLFTYHSWALLLTGQVEAVNPRLEDTEWLLESFSDDDAKKQEMVGYVAGLKAIQSLWQRDFRNGLNFANQAIENLPESNWIRGYCAIVLGSSYWGSGDLSRAKDAYKESYLVGQASGSMMLAVSGGCNFAHAIELEGYLQEALELFQDLFELAEQDGKVLPVAGYIHVEIARLFHELNQLDRASQHLIDGIQLCKQLADGRAETIGYGLLVRVQLAQGNIAEAVNTVQKAKDANPSPDTPFDLRGGEYPEVWLWLKENNFKNLDAWLKENRVKVDEGSFFQRISFAMHARILIALGREHSNGMYINDALELLNRLLELIENNGWGKKVVEILALQALAYEVDGKTHQAISTLERALTMAEPNGFIRTFVDEGPPMARLLYEALSHEIAPDYVQRLLKAFPVEETEKTDTLQLHGPDSELIEPLSEREIEVLQFIAQGLSNREVGERLYLTLNTVKAHSRTIYSKLGVNNRTQAVAKARALGIISDS